ncbi:MAG: hypothetical protein A3H54_01495 [Candidatus Yanofskybacteria bacterium RIFCSPLOWO2_02_FULL_41_13]|nr:MAG: hypothetical protein A3H54_01495 [Candidatus Yanofskybacteria bacterium RIFCSPLOWO2_02_FULL_41_13]
MNLTQKVADLALGGLVEGSLKLSNANFESSVDNLTASVMDEGLASFFPNIDLSQIKTSQSIKENEDAYFQQIDVVLEKFVKALRQEADEINSKLGLIDNGGMANPKFIAYFISQKELFDSIAEEGMQIVVPADWSNEHLALIGYILQLSEVNEALAQGKDDPVRAAMGFNLFVSMLGDLPKVIESFLKN